jgi:hypothetical protein
MSKKPLFFLTTIILLSGILPAFAEVAEFQLDRTTYLKGDIINVKGSVTKDASGLVTIVLRDPNDKFVLLSQAFIQTDDSFEKTIPINEKFQVLGTHNATAFVLNMTAGITQSFDLFANLTEENVDSNNDLVLTGSEFETVLKEESKTINQKFETSPNDTKSPIEKEPKIEKQPEILIDNKSQIADFVDKDKEPQYYLDRYYNEPVYQSWFDRNYPDLTIEEAIGYPTPKKPQVESIPDFVGTEIIPKAQASSVVSSISQTENNSDITNIALAVGGLLVLFGAVYGIKKKTNNNSKHISLNRDLIRRKIFSPIIDSNPMGIIQTRLAKGEITIKEYEKLKQRLDKSSK